jgi:hypothetical protein
LQGIFTNWEPILRFSSLIGEQIQWLAAKFPTQRSREFFLREAGNLASQAGNFRAKCWDFEF